MDGKRHSVAGADGVEIGLLTAGTGPALLLVHGGMGRLEGWEPMWGALAEHWRVTAMDRRGRASSGDSQPYALSKEYEDLASVAAHLAQEQGGPIDVFAHSYGATCALGAASLGAPSLAAPSLGTASLAAPSLAAPIQRLALYEPPGPQTVPLDWYDRVCAMVAAGQAGRAMLSFLTEIIGLTAEQVEEARNSPGAQDVLPIVSATLQREGLALIQVDLLATARTVACPVLLLLGENSPHWARDITHALAETLATPEVVRLPGIGHEAIFAEPDLLVSELRRFFDSV